jgi:hypothetical protein
MHRGEMTSAETTNIGRRSLTLIWKPPLQANPIHLRSACEINQSELAEVLRAGIANDTHYLFEGGWYFNDIEGMQACFPKHQLFYLALQPGIAQLRRNYLARHPKSAKRLNHEGDWSRYEKTVWNKQLPRIEKLLVACQKYGVQYSVLRGASVEEDQEQTVSIIQQQNTPCVFMIVGPNAAGKSTLLHRLHRHLYRQ